MGESRMTVYDKIIKGRDTRINELGIECDEQASKIKQLKDEIKQLERFRDDLKCCGNCKYNGSCYCDKFREEWCVKNKNPDCSGNYCPNWQFDGMHQKDRKIN